LIKKLDNIRFICTTIVWYIRWPHFYFLSHLPIKRWCHVEKSLKFYHTIKLNDYSLMMP